MHNRKLGAALLFAAAASIVLAAPVAAAPQPAPPIDFGSLTGPQSPQDNPGAPNSRNGVNSIQLTVGKWFGSQHGPNLYDTKFAPNVKWSASWTGPRPRWWRKLFISAKYGIGGRAGRCGASVKSSNSVWMVTTTRSASSRSFHLPRSTL